tara:strand:+ start:1136 stop:1246 length:111 start_codon:yes stop_codon:yes gene_type:complete
MTRARELLIGYRQALVEIEETNEEALAKSKTKEFSE